MASKDDDDYGDDFEDYDDEDFEEEEESFDGRADSKQSHSNKSSIQDTKRSNNDDKDGSSPRPKSLTASLTSKLGISGNHNQNQITKENDDPKGTPSNINNYNHNRVEQAKGEQYNSMFSMGTKNMKAADPRLAKRLEKLKASGILDMQEESKVILNIMPSSPYDHYHLALRSADPSIKQSGAPNDDDTREMETNTDEITTSNKEMQFCYGDDTDLLNVMKAITLRKQDKFNDKNLGNTLFEVLHEVQLESGIINSNPNTSNVIQRKNRGGERDKYGNQDHTQLGPFLQQSSRVCETILDEQNARTRDRQGNRDDTMGANGDRSLFDSSGSRRMQWLAVGGDEGNGANELIRQRRCVAIRFSPLQPGTFVTVHPPPSIEEDVNQEDLKPHKGLLCIWDVSQPDYPTWVLECSGSPVCAVFSASQSFLLVAGTSEGVVHMWDLREPNKIHKDRDAIDLGIERGVRKPCSSSNLIGFNASEFSTSDVDFNQHNGPVVQAEAVSTTSSSLSSVSQFATLDASGTVILWVTAPYTHSNPNPYTHSQTTVSINNDTGDEANIDSDSTILLSQKDLSVSPWGKVRLLQSRVLNRGLDPFSFSSRLTSLLTESVSSSSNSNGSRHRSRGGAYSNDKGAADGGYSAVCAWPSTSSSLACVPGNGSTLLLATAKGAVRKLERFGNSSNASSSSSSSSGSTTPVVFVQGDDGTVEVNVNANAAVGNGSSAPEVSISAANVTCIAVGSQIIDTTATTPTYHLMLMGRDDGTVDLYRSDMSRPLRSWDLFALQPSRGSSGGSSSSSSRVELVKWCDSYKTSEISNNSSSSSNNNKKKQTSAATAFFAVLSTGQIYYFDLMVDMAKPYSIDSLPSTAIENNSSGRNGVSSESSVQISVDVSHMSGGSISSRRFIACAMVGAGMTVGQGCIFLRQINPRLIMSNSKSNRGSNDDYRSNTKANGDSITNASLDLELEGRARTIRVRTTFKSNSTSNDAKQDFNFGGEGKL